MSHQINLHSGIGTIVTVPGVGDVQACGTVVPSDNAVGYAPGCHFYQTDGSGNTLLYVNFGTRSAAAFKAVGFGGYDPTGFPSGFIPVGLTTFREVDASGDVGDTTANGGVLASDTTPILLGDTAEAMAIQWASSNSDPLAVGIALPPDFDASRDCYVDLRVTAGGTTNAPSFTVETSADGAAKVSDTAAGAAQTAIQTITATIAAGDIPSGTFALTIGLTPGAHTTDAWNLYGVRLRYHKKAVVA